MIGIRFYVSLAVLLAVGVTAGAMVLKYNDAIEDAAFQREKTDRLEAALRDTQHDFEVLQTRYEMVDQVLKEKQNAEQIVRRSLYRFERKLGDLRSSDPVVRDWADTPIPDAVLGIMQDNGADNRQGDSVRVPPTKPDDPDAGARAGSAGRTP